MIGVPMGAGQAPDPYSEPVVLLERAVPPSSSKPRRRILENKWVIGVVGVISVVLGIGRMLRVVLKPSDRVVAKTHATEQVVYDGKSAEQWVSELHSNEKNAASALKSLGRKAVPALIKGLKNDDRIIVFVAISTLGEIGPEASESVPTLVAFIEDSKHSNFFDSGVSRAVVTLGKIGPKAKASGPVLLYLWDHISGYNLVHRGAIGAALVKIGSLPAEAVITVLDRDLDNSSNDPETRKRHILSSLMGFRDLGPPAFESVPLVIDKMIVARASHNEDDIILWNCVFALESIDPRQSHPSWRNNRTHGLVTYNPRDVFAKAKREHEEMVELMKKLADGLRKK